MALLALDLDYGTSGNYAPAALSPWGGGAGTNYQDVVWGSYIPITGGFRTVDGVVIWSGPTYDTNFRTTMTPALPNFPGDTSVQQQTYDIVRTFAVALGKRVNTGATPQVRRIWVDGNLAFSNGTSIPVIWAGGPHGDYLISGQYLNGVYIPNPGTLDAPIYKSGGMLPLTYDAKALTFRFHDGSETQMPDPAIVADKGNLAPGYRGLMYLVIEGLVVGKGQSVYQDLSDFGAPPNSGALASQYTNPLHFPVITVELADGTVSTATDHDFTMLSTSVALPYPDANVLADWNNRRIAVIAANPSPATSQLHIYDIDTGTEINDFAVADGGFAIGEYSFAAWDKLNNIIYTERNADVCICSVNAANGTLIDSQMTVGFNLSPHTFSGGTTITDADPATQFPRPTYADVDYVLGSGHIYPCVMTGKNYVGAFAPSDAGLLQTSLPPRSFYTATSQVYSCMALKLYLPALQNFHLTEQDACFVLGSVSGVELVYVTILVDGYAGSGRSAKIRGRTQIYTPAYVSSISRAFVDHDGNIVIQETKPSNPQIYTRIKINTNMTPDFTAAPGWRGLFPHVGATMWSISGSGHLDWEGNEITNSDYSGGTYCFGTTLLHINEGTYETSGTFNTSVSNNVWDSLNSRRIYHGSMVGSPGQTFTGHGLKYRQNFSGVNGVIGTVGGYVRDFAHLAGYLDANLDIDPNLTDLVPGIKITHPYDATTLFNSIGALYEFNYFNSANKLKFSRVSNTPAKATGGWTISGSTISGVTSTVQDGDTATIGAVVYRFKLVPVAPFDVKISLDSDVGTVSISLDAKQKTAANFLAAIMGDLSLAAYDSKTDGFFAGTVAHPLVAAQKTIASADNFGFTGIALTAKTGGVAGNAIVTTKTGTHMAFTNTTLLNGSAPPPPTATLLRSDLAYVTEQTLTENDGLVTTLSPAGQAQRAAAVAYYALENNYQPSVQTYIPDNQTGLLDVSSANTITYELPFILSTSDAYSRVAKTAIRQADNEVMQELRLTQSFMLLEPNDVISVTIPPFVYTLRLDEATFNGDFSTSFSAANFTFRSDVTINDSDAAGAMPQTIASANDCMPVAIDAPLREPLRGTTAGIFDMFAGVRAYTTGFGQGTLTFGLTGASGSTLFDTSQDVKWGLLQATLPTAVEPFYRTVEASITISSRTIRASDLQSATYQEFVKGVNCLAIGKPGNWEYVYFRDVVQLSTKVFQLTGLIRAQRGTDAAIVHAADDLVLLLASKSATFNEGLRAQPLTSAGINTSYTYLSAGVPSTRGAASLDVTPKGYDLYPFSPCRLKAHPSGVSNDLTLSWLRRDRLATQFVTVPTILSETSELYDLEILSGSTVVRTVNSLVSPTYNYTTAQQTTDGFSPPLATLKFRVYQRGELGRGFPRLETVDVI